MCVTILGNIICHSYQSSHTVSVSILSYMPQKLVLADYMGEKIIYLKNIENSRTQWKSWKPDKEMSQN